MKKNESVSEDVGNKYVRFIVDKDKTHKQTLQKPMINKEALTFFIRENDGNYLCLVMLLTHIRRISLPDQTRVFCHFKTRL